MKAQSYHLLGLAVIFIQHLNGCTVLSAASSTHAVIVSSSRYWYNYRHAINALSVYDLIKKNGVPDENIILMIADEYAVNDRNPFKNKMFNRGIKQPSIFQIDTQIDYRGQDVTVENMIRAVLGTQSSPQLPVLQSDENSRLLVYLTGHGGDQFFKFQDVEEIMSTQIAMLFHQLSVSRKFQEALFIADTCQAFTLGDKITTPNVTVIGSSLRGESSYSHHSDRDIGLSIIERYTHDFIQQIEKHGVDRSIQDLLVTPHTYRTMDAHLGVDDSRSVRKLHQIPVSDFFANKNDDPLSTGHTRAVTRTFAPDELLMSEELFNWGALAESLRSGPDDRPSIQRQNTQTKTSTGLGFAFGGIVLLIVLLIALPLSAL